MTDLSGRRPVWVEGTTSYPFLAVARANGVDYGLVLSYADMLEHTQALHITRIFPKNLTWWTHPSRFDEGAQWASDTRTAMLVEADRQARKRAEVAL